MSKLPDLLLFDQQLTEEELAIQKSVRDYCDKSLMPRIQKANREELFDKEIYKELADLGLLGPHIKGYGCSGVSNVAYGLIAREIENPFAEIAMTGAGPNTVGFGDAIEANRTLVAQLKEEGWQPYSFRFLVRDSNGQPVITKSGKPKYKYISFKRLDPWSGTLMFLADFVDIEGQIGSQQKNDIATALTVAIGRNITDRTYIRGTIL